MLKLEGRPISSLHQLWREYNRENILVDHFSIIAIDKYIRIPEHEEKRLFILIYRGMGTQLINKIVNICSLLIIYLSFADKFLFYVKQK